MALIFLSTINYYYATAQSKTFTISGKVTSFEESLGLEGVSVATKASHKNSGTQADGTFSISVSSEDKILVFSLADYQTQEVTISPDKQYDVVLRRKGNDGAVLNQKKTLLFSTQGLPAQQPLQQSTGIAITSR